MVKFKFNSIIELVETFKTELDCYQYLEQIRWSKGIVCPKCGATHEKASFWRLKDQKTLKCSHCKEKFTVKTGTVFTETRLSLRKWFMAIFLLTSHSKGISSVQLAKDLGITQKTAWFLAHRIRVATQNFIKPQTSQFSNPVEADETYMGGKSKNKHRSKRVKGTQGRNTKTKTAIFGIMQRKTDDSKAQVIAYKINSVQKSSLQKEIDTHVKKGNAIYTDEWKGYKGLKFSYKHQFIRHSMGSYVNGNIHTNTIEGFWSIFKRMFIGVYHTISDKHIDKYLSSLAFRYNHIGNKANVLLSLFLSNSDGRLSYKKLIGA